MRQHVVPEDVGAKDRAEDGLLLLLCLSVRQDAHGGYLVGRPCHLVQEIGADAPDRFGPADPRPSPNSGIQDDRVKLGECLQEAAGEGARGEEIAQIDALGDELDPCSVG